MLQFVEDLLQLHGTGPEPVDLRTGRPVGGYHQIENGTGNAHRTGGVLFLTYRQVDRQLDPILEPARGAAAALAVALLDHAVYSVAALIACRARWAALRRP